MVSVSFASNVPLFEPPEVVVSAGPRMSFAEADGRVWNHGSAVGSFATGSIPISDDPAGVPSAATTTEPFAGPRAPAAAPRPA